MTDADFWRRVRQQRDGAQPRQATDVELWPLAKGAHVAAATVRGVAGVGLELRYTWDGDLRESRIYANVEQLTGAATEKRDSLEKRGWTSR